MNKLVWLGVVAIISLVIYKSVALFDSLLWDEAPVALDTPAIVVDPSVMRSCKTEYDRRASNAMVTSNRISSPELRELLDRSLYACGAPPLLSPMKNSIVVTEGDLASLPQPWEVNDILKRPYLVNKELCRDIFNMAARICPVVMSEQLSIDIPTHTE